MCAVWSWPMSAGSRAATSRGRSGSRGARSGMDNEGPSAQDQSIGVLCTSSSDHVRLEERARESRERIVRAMRFRKDAERVAGRAPSWAPSSPAAIEEEASKATVDTAGPAGIGRSALVLQTSTRSLSTTTMLPRRPHPARGPAGRPCRSRPVCLACQVAVGTHQSPPTPIPLPACPGQRRHRRRPPLCAEADLGSVRPENA